MRQTVAAAATAQTELCTDPPHTLTGTRTSVRLRRTEEAATRGENHYDGTIVRMETAAKNPDKPEAAKPTERPGAARRPARDTRRRKPKSQRTRDASSAAVKSDQSAQATGTAPASVEVLVDGAGRTGILSYLPQIDGTTHRAGDEVEVPYGTGARRGTVLGTANDPRATRHITATTGRRSNLAAVRTAEQLAEKHLSETARVAKRLYPRKGREDAPAEAGPVSLVEAGETIPVQDRDTRRRRWLLLRTPGTDPTRLAAEEAIRIHEETGGQVLILCPTTATVTATLAHFAQGAVRVDARASSGAWTGLVAGTAHVAVGSRTSALYHAKKLAGIIVLDTEHPGHVESTQPRTHAREVASLRATNARCALTLISANPTPADMGSSVKIVRAGHPSSWPKTALIDRGQLPPAERLLPPKVRGEIRRAKKEGERVRVLAERRTATLRCRQCRRLWPCEEDGCSPSSCRHKPAGACVACGSRTRIPVGFDKERLAALLPDAEPVHLSELASGPKGGLVVVFDITPATRAAEWLPGTLAAQTIVTAAQAAGPEGTLLVCTWDRPDQVVQALCRKKDQMQVARHLWDTARAEGLPPYGRFVTVKCARKTPPNTAGWPGRVYGPRKLPAGEWELIVVCRDEDMPKLEVAVTRLRRNSKVQVQVA